jgi:hypothetical protein
MSKSSKKTPKTRNEAPDFGDRATFGRLARDSICMGLAAAAAAQDIMPDDPRRRDIVPPPRPRPAPQRPPLTCLAPRRTIGIPAR